MITIKNQNLELMFNNNGGLIGLVDLSIGRNYIEKSNMEIPLFILSLTEFNGKEVEPGVIHMSSQLAKEIIFTKVQNRIVFSFISIDNLNINVECEVRLEDNSSMAAFRISLSNGTQYAIKSIQYPVTRCIMQLGDSPSDDRILLPLLDGCLLPNPLSMSWEGCTPERMSNQRYAYPGEGREYAEGASAQLMAYYDPDGGLYMSTYDGECHPKELGPIWIHGEEQSSSLDFTPVHRREEIPGKDFLCEYDTVLGVFHGDWRTAADIYKTWAEKQFWCSRTLAEREDIPDWIKRGALFFNFRLRFQEKGELFLEDVPDYVSRWGDALGMPMVAMMSAWEKIGEWTGPDYFPPYGGNARFCHMNKRLGDLGIKAFPFGLSGMKLPIRKKIAKDFPEPHLIIDYDNRQYFKNHQQTSACSLPGSGLILDSEVESWDGLHGYACVSTPLAYEMLYSAGLRLIKDYAVDVVQADQVINGAAVECYNPDHGHALGRGQWQIDYLKRIYYDLRREGKKINSAFALSQELVAEPFLQSLDLYHSRNYDQPRGLDGVPLLSYLYHEYLPCYGGDWTSFLPENTSGVYFHGHNFVFGNLPAGCPLTMRFMCQNSQPEEADSHIIEMARNACYLFPKFTEYLLLGRMINFNPLNVPDITVKFFGMEFSGWHKRSMLKPAILHCVWRSPKNGTAYALANISTMPQHFQIDSSLYGINKKHILYINDAPGVIVDLNEKIELQPRDAAILEFL